MLRVFCSKCENYYCRLEHWAPIRLHHNAYTSASVLMHVLTEAQSNRTLNLSPHPHDMNLYPLSIFRGSVSLTIIILSTMNNVFGNRHSVTVGTECNIEYSLEKHHRVGCAMAV